MKIDILKNLSVKETATVNWTINDFHNLTNYVNSPSFYASSDGLEFQLFLQSNINIFGVNQVFISLYTDTDMTKFPFLYRVSIVDVNNQVKYAEEYIGNYSDSKNDEHIIKNFTYENYISYNDCFRYLVDGDLKICCQVEILEENPLMQTRKVTNVYENLQNNYQALLESSEFSDIVLSVKGKEFKAHNNILAARSNVFRAMLSNDLKEKRQNRVEITDVEVEVFEQLLRFIYAGKIPETNENILDLFIAADKYQLDDLKCACEHLLAQSLIAESAVKVLVIADMHSASQLKSKCLDYITTNSVAVKATEAWKQLKSRPDLLMELYDNISAKAHPFLKS